MYQTFNKIKIEYPKTFALKHTGKTFSDFFEGCQKVITGFTLCMKLYLNFDIKIS
jgi:putative lipoic acid-binding regulatory protein